MGKALRRLSLELLAVENLEQAAQWTVKLHKFGHTFHHLLNEKTYIKDTPYEQIPTSKDATNAGGTPTTSAVGHTHSYKT